jgi:hypothetical protein
LGVVADISVIAMLRGLIQINQGLDARCPQRIRSACPGEMKAGYRALNLRLVNPALAD